MRWKLHSTVFQLSGYLSLHFNKYFFFISDKIHLMNSQHSSKPYSQTWASFSPSMPSFFRRLTEFKTQGQPLTLVLCLAWLKNRLVEVILIQKLAMHPTGPCSFCFSQALHISEGFWGLQCLLFHRRILGIVVFTFPDLVLTHFSQLPIQGFS